MPGVRIFVDTNVLLYAHDKADRDKELAAKRWLLQGATIHACVVNLQVLNEFAYVLLRKRWFASSEEAFRVVAEYSHLGQTPVTTAQADHARAVHTRFGYSWWDCLLLASALDLGCSHFLSEDMQDGQRIEGNGGEALTIVNPFAHTPADILASIRD